MNRTPVSSSNLYSVGYDSAQSLLEVEFHDSGIYQYFAVPAHIYQWLISASSKWSYFAAQIRDIYHYQKIA